MNKTAYAKGVADAYYTYKLANAAEDAAMLRALPYLGAALGGASLGALDAPEGDRLRSAINAGGGAVAGTMLASLGGKSAPVTMPLLAMGGAEIGRRIADQTRPYYMPPSEPAVSHPNPPVYDGPTTY